VRSAGLPLGIADIAPEFRMWRRSWGGGRLAPVGWPLFALLIGLPLWWFLGVSAFIGPLLALPLVLSLAGSREVLAPSGFGWWVLFLMWSIVTATQLEGARDFAAFSYRLLGYLAATAVFLYLINVPTTLLSSRTVVRAMACFWAVVVAGGMLGIFLPAFSFPTVTEALLPNVLLQDPFVQDMVTASTSSAKAFAAYPIFRPKAPLPYTNMWASVYALTLPFAFAALTMRLRRRTWLWLGLIAISMVPLIFSLSRGAWLSIAATAVYALFRLLGRGRLRVLVGAVAILLLVGGLVLLTPLGDIILVRWGAGYSNEGRLNIYMESLHLARISPVFGYGAPVSVPGLPSAGTHGQLWTVLVSHGLPGTVLFLGGLIWMAVRSGRALWSGGARRPSVRFWSHLVIVVALVQLPFYALLPWGLLIVMVAAGLSWREALRESSVLRQLASSPSPAKGDHSTLPEGTGRSAPSHTSLSGGGGDPPPSTSGGAGTTRAPPGPADPAPVVQVKLPTALDLAPLRQARVASAVPKPRARSLRPHMPRIAWYSAILVAGATLMLVLLRPDERSILRDPGRTGGGSQPASQAPASPVPSGVVPPGVEGIVMPDLRGLSVEEATVRLKDLGLKLGARVVARGDPGVVVATDPSLGGIVQLGTKVRLYVGG
jgi:polysaccharide biosynthesis protein PslJ